MVQALPDGADEFSNIVEVARQIRLRASSAN
jgi:hypothetical protein